MIFIELILASQICQTPAKYDNISLGSSQRFYQACEYICSRSEVIMDLVQLKKFEGGTLHTSRPQCLPFWVRSGIVKMAAKKAAAAEAVVLSTEIHKHKLYICFFICFFYAILCAQKPY